MNDDTSALTRDLKVALATLAAVALLLGLASWAGASSYSDVVMRKGADGILRPLVGVTIRVRRPGNATPLATTTTNTEGRWSVTLTEDGLYDLEINGEHQITRLPFARDADTVCWQGCCETVVVGTPEAVVTGVGPCHLAKNSTTGDRYRFLGTPGQNTGWSVETCAP